MAKGPGEAPQEGKPSHERRPAPPDPAAPKDPSASSDPRAPVDQSAPADPSIGPDRNAPPDPTRPPLSEPGLHITRKKFYTTECAEELARAVEAGLISAGAAVDFGAGAGQDAIFLARHGFSVTAVGSDPALIDLACANARKAGVGGAIDFRVGDALEAPLPSGSAALVSDVCVFHELDARSQKLYVERVAGLLAPRGFLFLMTLSSKAPARPGPRRFSRQDVEALFSRRFDTVEVTESAFNAPGRPLALAFVFRKKG